MKLTTLNHVFYDGLMDISSAEGQLLDVIPEILKKTSTKELREIILSHLNETKEESNTVSDLCKEFSLDPEGKHCIGMEGILEEGLLLIQENTPSKLLDLAIIGILQKIEHYEVASYGTAANYAQELGLSEAQDTLHRLMQEEKSADEKLTALAEQLIGDITNQDIIEATT